MMTTSNATDFSDDILDLRSVVERLDELTEQERDGELDNDEADELAELREFASAFDQHIGGSITEYAENEPTMIADRYFIEYAQELAEDIGAIGSENQWPLYCIDWERAARELQMDYSSVDFDGRTFWMRSY